MSQKYGNSCATYTIPLNISENDIFHIGRTYIQHFINLNVKTDDCKPALLKMHLEIDDSPSFGEIEERNIEHNNSSINGLRQSVQQHEEEIKALKDALQQAKEDVVNQLKLNRIDSSPNVDNNAMQESNSNKQPNNENKLSGEHNDTENVASTSQGHHTSSMPKEKSEVINLRRNCVYIDNFPCSDSSIEMAFHNIRKLANEMNVEIPYDSVIYIDVKNCSDYLNYYVYFCNASIKNEFLKNRHFLIYNPETNPVRIFDYSEWGILDIENVESSDLSLKTAYAHVIGIANKMGMTPDWEVRNSIDHIDVFSTRPNFLTYSVRFNDESMREKFLHRTDVLKQFSETKSLKLSDKGGHALMFWGIDDFSITVVGANVIGVAELFGLSLTTNNIKRIYVLNHGPYCRVRDFSINVEFSSMQMKDEFLEKKNKLNEIEEFRYGDVEISDINAEKNIVSIKYSCRSDVTALSFIGLAKQLGYPFTPDKVNHFINLSIFIDRIYY